MGDSAVSSSLAATGCDYDEVRVPGRKGDDPHFLLHSGGRYSLLTLPAHGIDIKLTMRSDAKATVEPVRHRPTTAVLD